MTVDQGNMNEVYSSRSMKRRYEVWFLRCGLGDGSGAWWFRYLVMNLGRGAGSGEPTRMPAQVWATWFPRAGEPRSFIQGYSLEDLQLSGRKQFPFHCRIAGNGIEEGACWGDLRAGGHAVSWKLGLHSDFGVVLSDKGWIGFSKSPHSDAVFAGEIVLDKRRFAAEPLGFGVQGHNCGYRHRSYWRWMHAYFPQPGTGASTLEALVYDLPLGLVFRKAVLWHEGKATVFRKVEEREIVCATDKLQWGFAGVARDGRRFEATVEAASPGIHRLAYAKTDGRGTLPVANASLARAVVRIAGGGGTSRTLETAGGAVLEMGGK